MIQDGSGVADMECVIKLHKEVFPVTLILYNRLIFEKNVLLVLRLKVCSIHYLILHSLAIAILPPVDCSYIFLSEKNLCTAQRLLHQFKLQCKTEFENLPMKKHIEIN